MQSIPVIVLAGGQSRRFKSGVHKLLFPLLERPTLAWVLYRCQQAALTPIVVIVPDLDGPIARLVRSTITDERVRLVAQTEPLGTGDAVARARAVLDTTYDGPVVIVNGDAPAVRPETYQRLLEHHIRTGAHLTLTTGVVPTPGAYGRILRTQSGRIRAIREASECTPEEQTVREINLGIYVVHWYILQTYLDRLPLHPDTGEKYLTDVVQMMLEDRHPVESVTLDHPEEAFGINTWEEMHTTQTVLRRQIVADWMQQGVHFLDPERVWIGADVRLGQDVTVYPNVTLQGNTQIGDRTALYPGVRIRNSVIGADCIVWDHTVIEDSTVGNACQLGPFARLRPGCTLADGVRIGNFVELKKTSIGTGTKAMHLTYLGDAVIGKDVNIGAGTITCNYDGIQKYTTVIGDRVFIGSDSQLIAPVRIESDAYVAAGSTITRDVPSGSLAIARARQENKPGWVKRFRRRRSRTRHTSSAPDETEAEGGAPSCGES